MGGNAAGDATGSAAGDTAGDPTPGEETGDAAGETAGDATSEETGDAAGAITGNGRSLEVYEWGGGIAAGLGFLMTPLVTGLPALYCALKIREEKPLASAAILALLGGTVLFWAGFVFGDELAGAVLGDVAMTPAALAVFGSVIFVVPLAIFAVLLVLRR